MKTIPVIPKPTIQRIESTMGNIYVFRNPITKAWLFNITIAKRNNLDIDFRPNMALAKFAYVFSLIAIVLVFFVGCNPMEETSEPTKADRVIAMGHPTACVESFPVVPEDVMKGITKGYDYKIANEENGRSRCFDYDSVEFACKSKANDTLYIIDTYCPATLKARAELGGN